MVYPVIPFVDYVILPASYLSDQLPPSFGHIGWFVHETTHSFRNPAERSTTFGEVEATAVQVGILQEIGGSGSILGYMIPMLVVGVEGGQVTRDLESWHKPDAYCQMLLAVGMTPSLILKDGFTGMRP